PRSTLFPYTTLFRSPRRYVASSAASVHGETRRGRDRAAPADVGAALPTERLPPADTLRDRSTEEPRGGRGRPSRPQRARRGPDPQAAPRRARLTPPTRRFRALP